MIKDKNVVIGVTGGIAAYKICDVISILKKKEINVFVIMTKNATNFITPLTLQTLSKNKVALDMFENVFDFEVKHISLAQKADLILVAPATANIIGKVANGIADDMLSTTILATKAKVVFVPAMNNQMFENVILQNNIQKLKNYGYEFINPQIGNLACGYVGVGKLAKTEEIVNKVVEFLGGENEN